MKKAGSELAFPDIAAELWEARRPVSIGLLMGLLAASLFIFMALPHFRAQMTLSPANPMSGAESSSLMADDSLFALRYLVQRVGVSNSSDFMRFENTYAGASVAGLLLKDEKIREGLAEDRPFRFSGGRREWTPEELSEYIGRRVKLESIGATPMRRMVYQHPAPGFAAYFLRRIHYVTDELIRQRIREESVQRIRYLEEAIARTGNPENRRALTTLLLEQERLLMLVSIDASYAAAIVEPPSSGARPWWPQPLLVFPAFALAGGIAGLFCAGLRGKGRFSERWFRRESGNMNRRDRESARNAAE